jgi:hypothetical protein
LDDTLPVQIKRIGTAMMIRRVVSVLLFIQAFEVCFAAARSSRVRGLGISSGRRRNKEEENKDNSKNYEAPTEIETSPPKEIEATPSDPPVEAPSSVLPIDIENAPTSAPTTTPGEQYPAPVNGIQAKSRALLPFALSVGGEIEHVVDVAETIETFLYSKLSESFELIDSILLEYSDPYRNRKLYEQFLSFTGDVIFLDNDNIPTVQEVHDAQRTALEDIYELDSLVKGQGFNWTVDLTSFQEIDSEDIGQENIPDEPADQDQDTSQLNSPDEPTDQDQDTSQQNSPDEPADQDQATSQQNSPDEPADQNEIDGDFDRGRDQDILEESPQREKRKNNLIAGLSMAAATLLLCLTLILLRREIVRYKDKLKNMNESRGNLQQSVHGGRVTGETTVKLRNKTKLITSWVRVFFCSRKGDEEESDDISTSSDGAVSEIDKESNQSEGEASPTSSDIVEFTQSAGNVSIRGRKVARGRAAYQNKSLNIRSAYQLPPILERSDSQRTTSSDFGDTDDKAPLPNGQKVPSSLLCPDSEEEYADEPESDLLNWI